ncbi:MAG: squalene/phytoene synthase family protein [Sphingomicrobium sp.]
MAERALDPDRQIALANMPWRFRPAFAALWTIDLALADVVATTSEPALGAIRLAWWREALATLDEAPPPAEPTLRAVASELLPHGIRGTDLSALADCWLPLLEPTPDRQAVADALRLRGTILFGTGARLLGWQAEVGAAAGALWSLVDGARQCSDVHLRAVLLDEARRAIALLPLQKPPRALRPMTVLAALAAHDVLRNKPLDIGGGTGRGIVASLHQLRGSLPRG